MVPIPDNLVIIYVRYHGGGRDGKGSHKLEESEIKKNFFLLFLKINFYTKTCYLGV